MKNIAIFASGNGTNCENIINYFKQSELARTSLVVCNNPKAAVTERARKLGVPVLTITKDEFNDSDFILNMLKEKEISLIVLAGFMLLVPRYLTEAYSQRIINIHPSLLPKYGGKGMYGIHVHEAVKANKEKESGITIHYVNSDYDKGQIIKQYTTPISDSDSAEDIARKVHVLEYKYFPKEIELILKEDRQ